MKAYVQDLWPTKIVCSDDLLEPEHIDSMKQVVLDMANASPRENWQSSPDLHQHKKFKPMVDKIMELANWHLKNHYKAVYEKIVITDMWANILSTKEFHRPHTHSNNILSGVYYLQANDPKSAKIFFMDPRPAFNVIQPQVKQFTHENSSVWHYPSVTNRCLLFPSWLQHYVENNNVKEDRISVAFNFMYKGKIGLSEHYQSSEF